MNEEEDRHQNSALGNDENPTATTNHLPSSLSFTEGLSAAVLEKAEKELGEKIKWRQRDIQTLRDMIKSNQGLFCPDDDAFLLMFLRARKFDYERAYELVQRYYGVRLEYADFFSHFKPSAVQNLYDGTITRLPRVLDTDPAVLLVRLAKWNPAEHPLDDVLRANLMQIEKLIRDEPNQVNGFIMIQDMAQVSWNQMKNMNPFVAKKITTIIQNAMPCRLKAMHYVSVPHFFEYIFAMVKPFLSEKLQNRIHIHAGPEYLSEHFDMKLLPATLGGELDEVKHCQDWKTEMISSEEEFKQRANHGFKEITTVSNKDSKACDPIGGITGTFRKLSYD